MVKWLTYKRHTLTVTAIVDTQPRHPIRVVSRRTGIAVDTLRVWERRYAVVKPARNVRGRLYSDGDIYRLQLLAAAVAEGYGIGRVAGLPDDDLQQLSGPSDAG